MVFAHLGPSWAPCGQLLMTEEGSHVLASSFAYGLNYARRPDALEVDPVSLSLKDRDQVLGKRLLPAQGLALFGGLRDAAPDAWGRRVNEAKLKVPANSLPESQYLLHAGSDRVGALDLRPSLHDEPTQGCSDTPSSVRRCVCAAAAGLQVPPVEVRTMGARKVMLIRRFHRYGATPGLVLDQENDLLASQPAPDKAEHRMGFVSGLTMVGCDESESPNQGLYQPGASRAQHAVDNSLDRLEPIRLAHAHGDHPGGCAHRQLPEECLGHQDATFLFSQNATLLFGPYTFNRDNIDYVKYRSTLTPDYTASGCGVWYVTDSAV